MRYLAAAVLLVALPSLALAQQTGIQLADVWARPGTAGHTSAVYLSITGSAGADRLTGAATPVAAKTELHETSNDQGVMKMRPVDGLPVEPGKPLRLAPGGYHIMLVGLTQALSPGETFPVTLTFEHAGQITATATVRPASGATEHGGMPMHNMAMPAGATHH